MSDWKGIPLIEALRIELENERGHRDVSGLDVIIKHIEKLELENQKLKECLGFYGDINNWTGEDCNGWNSTNVTHESDQDERLLAVWKMGCDKYEDEYDNVGGKRARALLKELERDWL